MSTIVVNGTPLQPAIDAAQPGDVLDVRAGGYAGRLRITKSVSIKGDGGVIIDGGSGDGSGNVNISVEAAKNVGLSGLELPHGCFAVRYRGDCTGSIAEYIKVPVVEWMYRGTGTSQTGGNGFVFDHASGVEVRHSQISKCRAPSSQYTVDGGPFEVYSAQKIYIHHNEVWDCPNSGEFGKSAGDPDNSDIRIEDNLFHGRANPTPTSDLHFLARGILLRALIRGSIQRNVFDLVDHWSLNFDLGGTYGSSGFGAITVKDNTFRLLPGQNRMVALKAGIPLSAFTTFDANKVFTTSSTTRVAEIAGVAYAAGDLAKFRTDTGFEKTATWTVGPLPPIPPIVPPVPVDPCASVKGERDAAIASLDTALGQLATANTALAAANAKIAAAKAALG